MNKTQRKQDANKNHSLGQNSNCRHNGGVAHLSAKFTSKKRCILEISGQIKTGKSSTHSAQRGCGREAGTEGERWSKAENTEMDRDISSSYHNRFDSSRPMRSYDCACSELKIAVHHLDLRGKSIKGMMSLKKNTGSLEVLPFRILYIQTKTRCTDDYCSVWSLY